jgi:hypothetical protein
MEISISVPVTCQTGILLIQWQQANRVVLDGAP